MTELYPRTLWPKIKKFLDSPQAIVITGMRRSGKTSLMRYIFDAVPSKNKLFLDIENPITRRYFEETNYDTIKTNLQKEGLDFSQKPYVFLDEIQWLRQLPSIVKYLYDHYQIKFFLTGSASFYLKNLFSESLAGRKFLFELFPLSFREFIEFKKSHLRPWQWKSPTSEVFVKTIEPLWQEYLTFGGFPEVVLAQNPKVKQALLADIFTSYFQKEIEQLSDFRKTNLIRDLISLLAENTGNILNLERISSELKVSRLTVEEWIYFLEATYLISLIPPFSKKERVAIRKAKKVYFVDWALAGAISQITPGQRFEDSVFQLLRLIGNVSYFRKKSGAEIDFIMKKGREVTAFEAKTHPHPSDLNKLKKLALRLGIRKYDIVSQTYSPLDHVIYPFQL